MRFGTMFSGGGGADLGLMAAGLTPTWGVEYDEKIAAVYAANIGAHVLVADVRAVDYAALPRVDWLHASPVCTRASVANANASESDEDLGMARAVVAALEAQTPAFFTLENVWQYRNFAAFRLILAALERGGWFYDYTHVNAADYGVPQTRKRLILRASRGLLPALPQPSPWVGWYAAVEDLLPGLPDSQLAPWQLARLPADLREAVLFSSNGNYESFGDHHAAAGDPALTVSAQALGRARAVLVDQVNASTVTQRDGEQPSFTISVYSAKHQPPRAVLVKGGDFSGEDGLVMAAADAPSFGMRAGRSEAHRAILPGRVVAMSPRCLARFQSFPDSYRLPDGRALAAKVIGNAVPPLLMQRVAQSMGV
jgi:DNA (cytosine-5)-methyltransferase 1